MYAVHCNFFISLHLRQFLKYISKQLLPLNDLDAFKLVKEVKVLSGIAFTIVLVVNMNYFYIVSSKSVSLFRFFLKSLFFVCYQAYTYKYIHTYIHPYIHGYIHTYISTMIKHTFIPD